jgi:3-phenylpropionate/trans-cinnamate dioxygenase ferredoxin subunit
VADVTITFGDNGSYHVEGTITLIGPDGSQIEAGEDIWLCRCGGSATKPFCDGTHSKIGFAAAEAARVEFDRKKAKG